MSSSDEKTEVINPEEAKEEDKEEKLSSEEAKEKAKFQKYLEDFQNSLLQPSDDDIVVKQDDPNSPLHSIKSFEELGLHENLLKGVYQMNFRKPSKIQGLALPMITANPPKNLIAQAQSGTGKTAAFALGMLSRIDTMIQKPQALCICHTRELAQQILGVVQKMGQFMGLRTCNLIKDDRPEHPLDTYQIIVGTPGKLRDMVKPRRADDGGRRGGRGGHGGAMTRKLPTENIKVFVIDEADELLGKQGLKDQTLYIKAQLPKNIQLLMFSATFAKNVKDFVVSIVPNANIIALKPQQVSLDQIKQFYVLCEDDAKRFAVLSDIYAFLTMGQSIIFVHRRNTAKQLYDMMTSAGHAVSLLHGADMTSQDREKVMDDFRTSKTKVLITTNVLARGIDVLQTSVVINYDIPMNEKDEPDPETYIHRIGRSGRFGRKGIAISFVHDEMNFKRLMYIQQSIKDTYAQDFEIKHLDIDDIESLEESLQ